ncbi:MAG: hypothetical protein NVS4B7_11430 [Ktedonobacteraceae bacterium]
MMVVVMIGLLLAVLIATMMVLGWAVTLRRAPRSYGVEWSGRYIRALATLGTFFQGILILFSCASIFFLIPTLAFQRERQVNALFGGLDLLCVLAFYALWRWTYWLICLAASRT